MVFHRALLKSFGILLVLGLCGLYGLSRWAVSDRDLLRGYDQALAKRLPEGWVDESVRSARDLRESRKLFWAEETPGIGVALRAIENPELRDELFPGYPEELGADDLLWERYFKRDLSASIWLPELQSFSRHGIRVAVSWAGCVDIYERYGADILILGSSETFSSLVPAILSSELPDHPKTLMCATPSAYLDQAEDIAALLARVPDRRPRWIVLGVNLYDFYTDNLNYEAIQDRLDGLLAGPPADSAWDPEWDLGTRFLSLDSLRRIRRHEKLQSGTWELETGTLIPAEVEDDKRMLEAEAAKARIYSRLLNGVSEKQCNFGKAERILRHALASVAQLTPEIVLYAPPVHPFLERSLPPCYETQYHSLLHMQFGKSVQVLDGDAWSYGLTHSDFLHPTQNPSLALLDLQHLNYQGASRMTSRLAKLLSKPWSRALAGQRKGAR